MPREGWNFLTEEKGFASIQNSAEMNSAFHQIPCCTMQRIKMNKGGLKVERVGRHSEFLIERRERLANIKPSFWRKMRRKWNRLSQNDSFDFALVVVPWFLLPVSLCAIALGLWLKGRKQ